MLIGTLISLPSFTSRYHVSAKFGQSTAEAKYRNWQFDSRNSKAFPQRISSG